MRTTLALDEDALQAIQQYAESRGVSMGKAASELVRRGSRFRIGTKQVNGLTVFDVPEDFPKVPAELVAELLDRD